MVSPYNVTAKQLTEAYDLSDVQALLAQDDEKLVVNGDSRRTLRHFAALGFPSPGEEMVLRTIVLDLTPACFQHSIQYDNRPTWHDVYVLPNWVAPNGQQHSMYVKFKLSPSGQLVVLCSCHPEGWT